MGIVPRWLTMPNNKARLIAWLEWKRIKPDEFSFEDILRDGSYDLFRSVSESDPTRRRLFRALYDTLTKQEFIDALSTEASDA